MHSEPDAPARIALLEAQVAQLQRELQEFTYTVSHDLRAPLRHIVSFAKLVQLESAEQLNAEAQGFLANVVDSAALMGRMLDGVLALSRVGSAPSNPQPVALQTVLHAAAGAVQARYPGRTVDWQCASDLPPLCTDAALLQQALTELLDNAWKFTAQTAQAQVVLEVDSLDNGIRLRLRDNGAGFATQQAERLGLPFVRLHSAQQFPGIGLGLALARKCVQRLGGALQLQSAGAQQGCTVVLELQHLPASGLL
jgi:light-regulated signal transduction histidine kinase (bacteriophytochrome)